MDKKFLAILIVLGVFLRGWNYGAEGVGTIDAPQTIAQGLLFFYPRGYFPGLLMGQAPLGHFIIGLGCVLSGEDFSAVSAVPSLTSSQAIFFDPHLPRPYIAPEIISGLGEKIIKAAKFCLLPVYFAGILFFIVASILAVSILGSKRGLYAVAFLAFNPFLLFDSRYLHVDIFLYALVASSVYFLWQGYSRDKGDGKFVIAFALFGLAAATKFHALSFMVFALFIYFEKKRKIEAGALKLIVIYLAAFLLPFGFNPRNVIDVYRVYAANVPSGIYSPGIGIGFLKSLYSFFWYIGILDVVMIAAASYAFYQSRLSGIDRAVRFILYYAAFYFIVGFLFGGAFSPVGPLYLAFPFLLWLPLLISKGLDSFGRYSYAFIALYTLISLFSSLQVSPYYLLNTNPLLRSGDEYYWYSNVGEASDIIGRELSRIVGDNETFLLTHFNTASVHMYFRSEEYKAKSDFAVAFYNANGRPPTMEEFVEGFNFAGRWIRYIVIIPDVQYDAATGKGREVKLAGKTVDPLEAFLMDSCKPLEVVAVKGRAVAEVYDLANLTCGGQN